MTSKSAVCRRAPAIAVVALSACIGCADRPGEEPPADQPEPRAEDVRSVGVVSALFRMFDVDQYVLGDLEADDSPSVGGVE